ncbi:MAG: 2-amino-4-hydroxy-6-hydroxymethyldihydropteridine diphosphokinase [Acidimicrobiia bacterium]|nr:2-amino-4-hydroxy-6-hydroxymethyldihydropteridine diphosphokinase [Acidimicrobiia bacterium]
MSDRIEVNQIRARGTIGVLPSEQERSQPFEVDLVIEVDTCAAGESDDLGDALDYGVPIAMVHRVITTERHQLLERVATRIAAEVLALGPVHAVEVTIRKMQVPVPYDVGSTAVHIRRGRADPASRARQTYEAFVAMGSNLGDRRELLRYGVRQLERVTAISPVYETAPVGGPAGQGPYLNLVVALHTELDPFQLLGRCLAIEAATGRERTVRFGPRTLDLDVLLVDDIEIRSPQLTLPHPRMWDRRFVLQPLADLAPDRVPDGWNDRLPAGGIDRARDLEV